MTLEEEVLDRLLPKYEKPEVLLGENGLLKQLTKALMDRTLEAEMAKHLACEKRGAGEKANGNRRERVIDIVLA